MARPYCLQEMKAGFSAFFSLTLAYRTEIDFFFPSPFSPAFLCNTLFQQLHGVVSEVKAQRVTHLLITRRGNSSSHLVFLGRRGRAVFFPLLPFGLIQSRGRREEQFVSFMDDASHAGRK